MIIEISLGLQNRFAWENYINIKQNGKILKRNIIQKKTPLLLELTLSASSGIFIKRKMLCGYPFFE